MPIQIFFNLPEEKRNAIVTAAVRSFGAWHGRRRILAGGVVGQDDLGEIESRNVLIFYERKST